MKKIVKTMSMLFLLFVVCITFAGAAGTRKCYTIQNVNTTVYSNTSLTTKYGTIYGSDEITVINVTSKYCRVSYPISNGRTKTGYINTNAILLGTTGNTYTSSGKVTTYKRPNGASYGYISSGDKVTVLGVSGDYTQVKYPVSNGFKYAFITNSNANIYLYNNSSSSVSNGLYQISTALDSNMLIDVYKGNMYNGTNIEIYENNGGGSNQNFYINAEGNGWYTITSQADSNMALDVQNGEQRSNVNVQLYHLNKTDAQLWKFESAGNGYYLIKNKLGYYLDVSGGRAYNEANIIVFEKNGQSNQLWKLTPVNQNNQTVDNTSWRYPLNNTYVCGNNWRTYYKARPSRPYHVGIDIASSTGDTSILAAASGTVAKVGWNNSNGNYIVISHNLSGQTVYTFYAHLKSYNVSAGQTVQAGEKIGIIGNTGSGSVGTHLHFAITNQLKSGSYYGYIPYFSGDKGTYSGVTYYNPIYVISNGKLP